MNLHRPISIVPLLLPALFRLTGAAAALVLLLDGAAMADGQSLLRKADQFRAPGDNFVFDVQLSDVANKQINMTVRVREKTKGLVLYTAPKTFAGRSILYTGRNMWAFVPGTRRALRIAPQQQVLGAVSSADVARTVFSEDYKVVGTNTSGKNTELTLVAAGKGTAYARIVLTVQTSDARPLSADFYSANGSHRLKTLHFEKYKQVLGMPRPMQVRVVDHLDGGAQSVMRYSNMRIENTPPAWFQPSYLDKLK
ncbi:hypothetical protein RA19_24805 [Leisingera sp. ANG-M1]|uniref:outer membrane lipoprotein-sorting protein n=1 Tax=Leisingera sp. ANG-M1 TaxID=1577895 RepID=UPI00057CEEF2|nr:outer membrane lipoprotein-sorting protein [Leisingera sp. ANG-M1]KIC07222.1 hypothetical protein RA19_24805 [Leisingera sp. ANG-M1]